MTKNQEYTQKYAEYAQEQMRLYGIPASVTLAQGILESANGQSRLAKNENNHFGIKATKSWIEQGGQYALYTDDKPNEKFCKYDSVRDSFEHHSKFLVENKRYAECFKLPADDYRGWCDAIAKAGYASSDNYAETLKTIIERNCLDKYDKKDNYDKAIESPAVSAQNTQDSTQKVEKQAEKEVEKKPETTEEWMKKLLSSEDSGLGLGSGSDPVIEFVVAAFSSLLLLATQIDNNNESMQKQIITKSVENKSIDISSMMRGMKHCELKLTESGKMELKAVTGGGMNISHTLSSAELSRLSMVLNDNSLSQEAKQTRVSGLMNGIALSQQASMNFERELSEQQSREMSLRR